MNVGEISEFCFKAYMLRQRDENREDTVFGKIHELSDDANLADLEWKPSLKQSLDDNDWKTLSDELVVGKSKPSSKMAILWRDAMIPSISGMRALGVQSH